MTLQHTWLCDEVILMPTSKVLLHRRSLCTALVSLIEAILFFLCSRFFITIQSIHIVVQLQHKKRSVDLPKSCEHFMLNEVTSHVIVLWHHSLRKFWFLVISTLSLCCFGVYSINRDFISTQKAVCITDATQPHTHPSIFTTVYCHTRGGILTRQSWCMMSSMRTQHTWPCCDIIPLFMFMLRRIDFSLCVASTYVCQLFEILDTIS